MFEYDTDQKHFHRDILGRTKEKWVSDDRYLSHFDGRAKRLCVQTTDDIYRMANNSTYVRTFMRNTSPLMLRIAKWPMSKRFRESGYLSPDLLTRLLHIDHFDYINAETSAADYWLAAAKWIPSTCALTVMVRRFLAALGFILTCL